MSDLLDRILDCHPTCYGKDFPKLDNYCLGCTLLHACAAQTSENKKNNERDKAVAEQLATASLSDLQKAQKALQVIVDTVNEIGEILVQALQPTIDAMNEIAPILAETIRQKIMKEDISVEEIAESYKKVMECNKLVKISNTIYLNGEKFLISECPICHATYPKKFADQLVDNPKLCYKCEGLERCKEPNCNGILVLRKKWKEPMKKVCEKCGSTY